MHPQAITVIAPHRKRTKVRPNSGRQAIGAGFSVTLKYNGRRITMDSIRDGLQAAQRALQDKKVSSVGLNTFDAPTGLKVALTDQEEANRDEPAKYPSQI